MFEIDCNSIRLELLSSAVADEEDFTRKGTEVEENDLLRYSFVRSFVRSLVGSFALPPECNDRLQEPVDRSMSLEWI